MPKITKILSLSDLPLRLLGQFDDQLNDLFYHFEGDLDDLESYLTDRRFTIAQVNDDKNFFVGDNEFFILDCDGWQLEDYDLSDPEDLLNSSCDSFTIAEYERLFSSGVLIKSIREKITELLEVPYYLHVFGEVAFHG